MNKTEHVFTISIENIDNNFYLSLKDNSKLTNKYV